MTKRQAYSVLRGAVLAMVPVLAQAQPSRGAYLGVTVGAHIERSDNVEGSAPALGVVGGVRLSSSWGVEAEIGRPLRAIVRERTCKCFSFASSAADFDRLAVTERLRYEREVVSSVSVGAVYQPQVSERWSTRLFMGVSHHRVRESTAATILALPEGFDVARAQAVRPPSDYTRNLGGISLGGGVGYRVTRRIAIGPEVRYDYGSIGDEINNVWRTGVRSTVSF